MSPTAEQTEERNQHDEKDGSKRSPRRLSIVVWRLHWKALYLHQAVLRSYTNTCQIFLFQFETALQSSLLPVFIHFLLSYFIVNTGTQLNTSRVLVKIIQVQKKLLSQSNTVEIQRQISVNIKSTERFLSFVVAQFETHLEGTDFLRKSQTNEH